MFQERQYKPNSENFKFIPAGTDVRLDIRLHDRTKTPDAAESFPVFSDVINCPQGQTINLGKIYFPPEIPVFIKVLEPNGKSLEGVEVWLDTIVFLFNGRRKITDADGLARMYVPTNTNVSFIIGRQVQNARRIRQTLSCQIKGPEDANGIITFQLNDEVFKDLYRLK